MCTSHSYTWLYSILHLYHWLTFFSAFDILKNLTGIKKSNLHTSTSLTSLKKTDSTAHLLKFSFPKAAFKGKTSHIPEARRWHLSCSLMTFPIQLPVHLFVKAPPFLRFILPSTSWVKITELSTYTLKDSGQLTVNLEYFNIHINTLNSLAVLLKWLLTTHLMA